MCRCEDGNNGQFTCTPRCPVYTKLPSFCRLDTLPGECCRQLNCVSKVVTTTPDPSITTKPPRKTCSWCNDKLSNCDSYDQTTACKAPYDRWAKRNCANFCGMCDCDHAPTTKATIAGCTDKLTNCEDYGKDSCSGIFASWAKDNCKSYCGLCDDKVTQGGCHDIQPGLCQNLKDTVCTNVAYRDWSLQNCKKTCGTCTGNGVTVAPKSCQYSDGVTHAHGTFWVDGCNSNGKNCTCIDGQVSCLRSCPIYNNLQGWKLVDVPGECCPILKPVGQLAACNYKDGQSYSQGQTWSDGCKLTCQCTDATTGIYQCRNKCPQWNLPTVCHWVDPKPGKCCRQPVCPPPYEISGYPDE
uniref:Uncharacterized protein n=1 Tax=Pinctada fucata TaxID=50426 RepID=A0A194AN83_PINFU